MSLIKRMNKRFSLEKEVSAPIVEGDKVVGKFSNMHDGGTPAEIKDRSVVDIYHFENEENLTPEEWEKLKQKVLSCNPEGEYIASSKAEMDI